MHNKPLLPLISNKVCQYELFLDMRVHDKEYVHEQFLKSMFRPSHYEKLPPYNTLSRNVQNKAFTLFLCFKNYSKKHKTMFPRPLREIILQKFLAYERAHRIRDYLLTEITLLHLDYLDGKENFSTNIKKVMDFIKNDLLNWFDRQVQML